MSECERFLSLPVSVDAFRATYSTHATGWPSSTRCIAHNRQRMAARPVPPEPANERISQKPRDASESQARARRYRQSSSLGRHCAARECSLSCECTRVKADLLVFVAVSAERENTEAGVVPEDVREAAVGNRDVSAGHRATVVEALLWDLVNASVGLAKLGRSMTTPA